MGNCWPKIKSSESVNPPPHGYTPSSPPPVEFSLPTSGDPVRSSPPVEPFLPLSGDLVPPSSSATPMEPSRPTSGDPHPPSSATPMEPSRPTSGDPDAPSSATPMEPSLPTSGDPLRPSPVDHSLPIAGDPVHPSSPMEPISREPLISRDPVHPSAPMEPSLPISGDPGPSSRSIDAIESIKGMYEKIDPVELIDPLVSFIESHLHKMIDPSEAGSSSSEDSLATVGKGVQQLAAAITDTLSKAAEKVSESEAVKEMGRITLEVLEGTGESHQIFIGLSIAAYAAEMYTSVGSTGNECTELLLKTLQLSKDVKVYGERMSKTQLCNAVVTILEGAVMACNYLNKEKVFSLWSVTTAAAQLQKTNQQLRSVTDSFALSSLRRHWDKDVFLSHSGKQKHFVRQLYQDLTREHVSCFFEEERNSLRHIFEAAETCKIAVVVLSKEFICSKWPMIELSTFISAMKSGKNARLLLLPIFFNISPKELLRMKKDNPEWQNLNVNNDTRYKWQVALQEVRSISGLVFKEDGNEVECRDIIVKEICRFLKGINPPKLLDFEPVGVEDQVREVKHLLDIEGGESALAVIVCGFGGVGKSTVAAAVVQSLDWSSMDFKFCRVSIDEKAPDRRNHIVELQKYIIYCLKGFKVELGNPEEGRQLIKEALKKKRVLLFIDNVVDKYYVIDILPKELSRERNTKLRIIITSRAENVKSELGIRCKVYHVRSLSFAASNILLSKTILESSLVKDKDEEGMIAEVARACRGVPLLLSVFGKHLRGERDEDSYIEALAVLSVGDLNRYRDEDLGSKLMFVYNKIKDVEVKEAFLDICTYFHGWQWNLVIDIVDVDKCEDLRRRSLVFRSSSNEVIVHDILRSIGLQEANVTRFSNYNELVDAVEDNLDGFDMKDVKGISLFSNNHLITIESTKLEAAWSSLRVLMLGDWVTLEGPPCQRTFTNLRYLRVGDITAFPFKDPSKLERLRVFVNRSMSGMNLSHLPSHLKRISYEVAHLECDKFVKLPFQNLTLLKSLTFKTHKQLELPEELHLPASLEDLNIRRCKNLPKDIGQLTALESLILDGSDLECLPQGFDKLKKLKHLSMNYCSKLSFLSEKLDFLSSLEVLSMKGCGNLTALPQRLGGLLSLQTIEFSECIKLQVLPESFGNMTLLKDLIFDSCHSLMSLPNSFVRLKLLETLKIIKCTKLSLLPQDFGRLRCLKFMTVEECHLLKELPHGFGALPALETFTLRWCNSFENFPADFRELISLEKLYLEDLPLMSRIPDGFGKLKKLRFLDVCNCSQLETLSEDFETMATMEQLRIFNCLELEGAMMEKILKLPNCYRADINGSTKLLEKWEHMQAESEDPMVVVSKVYERDKEEKRRAVRIALLHGKCVTMKNGSHQLMERSFLFAGLEEGTTATVALIMLPINMQSHQRQTLEQFVETEMKTAETNGWGNLQIVCARKVDLDAERPTATEEEERTEEEGIRQILLPLPKGSCVIPSSEFKRVKILTYCFDLGASRTSNDKLSIFMANVWSDIEGRKTFENLKFIKEDEISGHGPSHFPAPPPSALEIMKPENKHYNSIQNFFKSICPVPQHPQQSMYLRIAEGQSESQCVAGESKTREFADALKDSGIHYLHSASNSNKVMIDELHGKTIGFIICDFKFLECIKLEQVYKDLQEKDSNFIWIWIPLEMPKGGHGSYSRLIQCMPWAACPHPQLVNVKNRYPCRTTYFVLLDKHGQIANCDALPLLLAWGVGSYPFTQDTIPESFSLVESESCLKFLLHGMNIVGRKQMKKKMTFLYAEHPSKWLKMKSKLEELTQIRGNFEILYVGNFSEKDISFIENFKTDYENAAQNMRWPSLSLSDMIKFWYRCKYMASKEVYELSRESSMMMHLHGFANQLYHCWSSLVLLDNDGPVTYRGEDVVQMICEPSDEIGDGEGMGKRRVKDELKKSLHRGECSSILKTFFIGEIHNYPPQHPQYLLAM